MDIILLGITVVSLAVALVMSIAAWRLTRDEKKHSAARVAALSLAAKAEEPRATVNPIGFEARTEKPIIKAPWAPAPVASIDMPLNQPPRVEVARVSEPTHLRDSYGGQAVSHASGFLGATDTPRDTGSGQKSLAFAAVMLFVVLSGGLVWMMSGPRGTSAAAIGPNAPLELVSLSHQRLNNKLAVSGLVRNPVAGKPIDHLSAVVFLFDKMGTFVTSSRANVDFLKLGAGDESPFVVSLEAPATVARYRVSFRTDDGIVPHIDRRGTAPDGAVISQQ